MNETIIILFIAAIFAGGYVIGKNESCSVPRYDLPESLYQEIHGYRICMADNSCRMFILREDK